MQPRVELVVIELTHSSCHAAVPMSSFELSFKLSESSFELFSLLVEGPVSLGGRGCILGFVPAQDGRHVDVQTV